MKIKQKISFMLIGFTVLLLILPVSNTAAYNFKNETFIIGYTNSLTVQGLTKDQSYIIVFTDHVSNPANVTFTASGYQTTVFIKVMQDSDNSFTANLYEYSISTGQNSSALLYSGVINIVANSDFIDYPILLEGLWIFLPVMFLVIFVSGLYAGYNKYLQK